MTCEPPVEAFLRRARRRYLTRGLLWALGASAAGSLALEYAVVYANRRFLLELPPVSIGLALLFVAGAACLRRNRTPAVAARADAALGLKDRLVTFLDFRVRTDVDDQFRRLQATEAAAALAAVDLALGIRIPRLLWAAPLLFAGMLYVDYFAYFVPSTPPFFQQVVRMVDPRRAATRNGEAPPARDAGEKDGQETAPTPAPERPAASPGDDPPAAPRQPGAEEHPEDPGPRGTGDLGEPSPPGAIAAMISEPSRLFSEPVGRSLTPVAADAPGAPPAAEPGLPEMPLRGRISFNLVPVDGAAGGPGGTGDKPGGGKAEGLQITVDYDAVPPEYRQPVRRYFNALARLFQGRNDGA